MAQTKLPPEIATQVFTKAQLAARYNLNDRLIAKMLNAGLLPYIRYSQQSVIIPIKALEAFEDELGRATARRLIKEDEEHEDDELEIT